MGNGNILKSRVIEIRQYIEARVCEEESINTAERLQGCCQWRPLSIYTASGPHWQDSRNLSTVLMESFFTDSNQNGFNFTFLYRFSYQEYSDAACKQCIIVRRSKKRIHIIIESSKPCNYTQCNWDMSPRSIVERSAVQGRTYLVMSNWVVWIYDQILV